jgi:hypothetical protein
MREHVVSPVDIEEARTVLAAVAQEARRRATGGADAPVLRVVVEEAAAVLTDSKCRQSAEVLARFARTARLDVVLRDAFPDIGWLSLSFFGGSMLIRDAVTTGVVAMERLPVGGFVPLVAVGSADDAIDSILGGDR